MSGNSSAVADLLNQIAYLVSRLKETAAPPGHEEAKAEKPKDTRRWLENHHLPFQVLAHDVVREQPAELDPQGEVIPFPATTKPSLPQWDVKFVEGEGLQPEGWEPFAVTDRHIALRRRVQ